MRDPRFQVDPLATMQLTTDRIGEREKKLIERYYKANGTLPSPDELNALLLADQEADNFRMANGRGYDRPLVIEDDPEYWTDYPNHTRLLMGDGSYDNPYVAEATIGWLPTGYVTSIVRSRYPKGFGGTVWIKTLEHGLKEIEINPEV